MKNIENVAVIKEKILNGDDQRGTNEIWDFYLSPTCSS